MNTSLLYNYDNMMPEFSPAYYIISLICAVLIIIGYWKLFHKAGEAGWKSIIPIYNGYILYKIAWKGSIFFLTLLLVVAFVICMAVAAGMAAAYATGAATILMLIAFACLILGGIIGIISYYKLSKAFGHGAGFTVGLIFLPYIFILILAFGSSKYVKGSVE